MRVEEEGGTGIGTQKVNKLKNKQGRKKNDGYINLFGKPVTHRDGVRTFFH